MLQGPSDVVRDRAAAVLASLPLCGEAEAWTQAAGRVALEAHGCVHVRLRCAQMKGFTYYTDQIPLDDLYDLCLSGQTDPWPRR